MTTREQLAQRRLTREYIKLSPLHVRMTSYERLDDDMGGWRYIRGEQRYTQTFRLIENSQAGSNAAVVSINVDGVVREIEFLLLGDYCADIRLHDRFEKDGDEFQVVEIWPDNGWEKRASVIRHARS